MSPLERAHALEKSQDVEEAHEFAANQGDSRQVEDLNEVDLHFVALVNVNGRIYEMDGRKEFPIDHGSTCPENFLNDAIQVVRKFLERDPNNLQFSLCALAPKQ